MSFPLQSYEKKERRAKEKAFFFMLFWVTYGATPRMIQ